MSTPMVKVKLASGEVVRAHIIFEAGDKVAVSISGMYVQVNASQVRRTA